SWLRNPVLLHCPSTPTLRPEFRPVVLRSRKSYARVSFVDLLAVHLGPPSPTVFLQEERSYRRTCLGVVFCPPFLAFHHCEAHVSVLGEPQVRGQGVQSLARWDLLAEACPCCQPRKIPLRMTQFQRR